jgi:hypothetical protein
MKPKQSLSWLCALLFALAIPSRAGTWSDHFSSDTLLPDWTGTRADFQIINEGLEGESTEPVAPSPFNFVEVARDSTDCTVGVWINVVMPNLRVCTKGAILARHTGTNGYVFALHQATQTAEIYQLSNHEMLLNVPWKIDLQKWYYVRAELHGPLMSFYIDGQLVGTINDSQSPSGAVGLAVQDAEAVRFDDFTITGPNVVGNVDDVAKPIVTTEQTPAGVAIRFTMEEGYDYYVQVSSDPKPSHDWTTLATYTAKLAPEPVTFIDTTVPTAPRFYRVEKVPCYCR